MATFRTSQGNSVPHCHVPNFPCEEREWTRAERREKRASLAASYPNVVEVRAPSTKYNCHGYAYADAHAWFSVPDLFIADDFFEVPMDEARKSDVLIYEDDEEITHSAVVKTATDGEIVKCRSKWGMVAAVVHDPDDVPREYGRPVRLLRRNG